MFSKAHFYYVYSKFKVYSTSSNIYWYILCKSYTVCAGPYEMEELDMLWKPNFPHICNQNVVKTLFCLIRGGGEHWGSQYRNTAKKRNTTSLQEVNFINSKDTPIAFNITAILQNGILFTRILHKN